MNNYWIKNYFGVKIQILDSILDERKNKSWVKLLNENKHEYK